MTEICEHICPPVREIQVLESSAHQEGKARYEGLPRIPVKASEIQKRVHTYEEPEIYSDSVTDEILEKLVGGRPLQSGSRNRNGRAGAEIF